MTTPTGSWSRLAIAAPDSTTIRTTLKVGRPRAGVNRFPHSEFWSLASPRAPPDDRLIAERRGSSSARTTRHDHPHPRASLRQAPPMRGPRTPRSCGGPPPEQALLKSGGPPASAIALPNEPGTAAGIHRTAPRERPPTPVGGPRVIGPGQRADYPRSALPATQWVDSVPSRVRPEARVAPVSTRPSPGRTVR